MDDVGEERGVQAARLVAESRFPVRPGLSGSELDAVEQRFGFAFADDHRAFLSAGVPVGRGWPDWRDGDPAELRARLAAPVEGVLFDVVQNDFWYSGWGSEPADPAQALAVARGHLLTAPRLVAVYAHRFLPAGRGTAGHPVLSVMQTDIVYYGTDLLDFVFQEFGLGTGVPRTDPAWRPRATVPFWRDLVG